MPWRTTAAQAQVLALIDWTGRPMPVTELSRAMLQESPSITRLVDRMTARGFVERLDDPTDRRRALVTLTKAGRAHLEQIRKPGAAAANEAFGVLSAREQATLKRLLRKFTEAALHRLDLT
jgi:DNA-binding MarR family transcriptional regulator